MKKILMYKKIIPLDLNPENFISELYLDKFRTLDGIFLI